MTIDQEAQPGLHEVIADLAVFERQQSALASSFGQLHRLLDQFLGVRWLVQERLDGNRGCPGELAEAEFHHGH